jgi:hypothetical protein
VVRIVRWKSSRILGSRHYRDVSDITVCIQRRTNPAEVLQIKGESNLVVRVCFTDFEKRQVVHWINDQEQGIQYASRFGPERDEPTLFPQTIPLRLVRQRGEGGPLGNFLHTLQGDRYALVETLTYVAFPKTQHPPAGVQERAGILEIAADVSGNHRCPIFRIVHAEHLRLHRFKSARLILIAVPEVTINEDRKPLSR